MSKLINLPGFTFDGSFVVGGSDEGISRHLYPYPLADAQEKRRGR